MRRILYQRRDREGTAATSRGGCRGHVAAPWRARLAYGMKVNLAEPVGTLPHGQNGELLRGRALARITT
jgi:hypothetical protein